MFPFLVDLLHESLIQNEEFEKIINSPVVFVPIPLSSARVRKRGYNQAEILAKGLAKKLDFPVVQGLTRIKETRSQVGLNKAKRQENMKGAFSPKKNSVSFQNTRVILMDDVLTTGSTFSEATYILKHNGAREVWAVALAKED